MWATAKSNSITITTAKTKSITNTITKSKSVAIGRGAHQNCALMPMLGMIGRL